MPVLSKRNPDRFQDIILDSFNRAGISTRLSTGNIARAVGAIGRDVMSIVYAELYGVTDNILPSEARNQYLNRYGELLGTDRSVAQPARDFSLTNVFLRLPGSVVAADLTIDAGAMQLPSGFELSNSTGSIRMRVVNSPVFAENDNRAFCQVIAIGNVSNIPIGSLTRASINLTNVPNVDINRLSDSNFEVNQPRAITTRNDTALNDQQYRFALLKRAEGLSDGNTSALEFQLLKIPTIARYNIRQHTHGNSSVTVFVESTDLQFDSDFLLGLQLRLESSCPVGTKVRVEQPEIIKVGLLISIRNRQLTDDEKIALANDIQSAINNLPAGNGITLTSLTDVIANAGFDGEVVLVQRNDRDAPLQDIVVRSTQKLGVFSNNDIVIQ